MKSRHKKNLCWILACFLLNFSSPTGAAQIRLTGSGSTQCSGRVEIFYESSWGTVCDDSWDSNDAEVVCRELNCGTAVKAPGGAAFGQGSGPIFLDDVTCSGGERSLTMCGHNGWGTHNCGHSEDAGVICSAAQIRLTGSGSTQCSGRVEIFYESSWGTVCDDSWDSNDAEVVCRELNCGTAVKAPGGAAFGQGSGPIFLDDVACSGGERSLTMCGHNGWGTHNCGHSEDAGVICSASIKKPRISRYPTGAVTWGQDVQFTCSVTFDISVGRFILTKTSGSFRTTQTSSSGSAIFNIRKVNFDHEGSYRCQYEKSSSIQTFRSPLSDSVRLSLTVSFPKPSISTMPVVTWGQGVSITCSVTTELFGGRFILTKTSGSFRTTQTSNSGSATFNIRKVNFDHEGPYQCQYEKSSSIQTFRSPLSDSVRLSLTVQLQQPNITLTSPNRGLIWSPEGAEVTRGYSFVFICSINCSFPDGRFFLISSDADITVVEPAVNHSASFKFPVAEYKHQGNYSCVYEVELSARRFNSTETAPTRIVIKSSLLPLVSSVAAGILFMLLVALLMVLVCCRRREQVKQPGTLDQTQLSERMNASERMRNFYEKKDDEEPKYVNVASLLTKNPKDQRGGRQEGDVYEEPERFTGLCLNSKMSKVKEMGFRDNQSEEEEETSDEDDNYENVMLPVTQAADDIHGDQEDIYQNL